MVASGTLPNGKPVVINSDGTASVVSATSVSQALGSPTLVPASGNSNEAVITYDSNSNKVVVAFIDNGQSNYGKAVVGTISGTSISFGTATVFESASTNFLSIAFDSNSNKIVIAYSDGGNGLKATAVVGTVSGTSISFGTPVVVSSGNFGYYPDVVFDANENKILIGWTDIGAQDQGRVRVGDVSGTSITFGTQTDFEPVAGAGELPDFVFDPTTNKVVAFYSKTNDEKRSSIGTISGTSVSFTSAQVDAAVRWNNRSATINPSTGKMYVSYTDINNSNYGTLVSATTDGTTITYGTPVVYASTTTGNGSCVFHEASGKIVLSNLSTGSFVVATDTGGSFTFDSPVVFDATGTQRNTSLIYDSTTGAAVCAYVRNSDNKSLGVFFRPAYVNSNLTETGYIGISSGGAAVSGQSTSVDIAGTVNEEQSGLTPGEQYYVQLDGTLGVTPASPSVFAGTAVASNKLIVLG